MESTGANQTIFFLPNFQAFRPPWILLKYLKLFLTDPETLNMTIAFSDLKLFVYLILLKVRIIAKPVFVWFYVLYSPRDTSNISFKRGHVYGYCPVGLLF